MVNGGSCKQLPHRRLRRHHSASALALKQTPATLCVIGTPGVTLYLEHVELLRRNTLYEVLVCVKRRRLLPIFPNR